MESNLKCFFLRGKYRVSDDFLVLILLIFGGLRYFFYYSFIVGIITLALNFAL